ncbi:MAG: EMC3/TMCO1 family protein [Nanoarchaeota archaeon]|jgi:uncharacterized membrane protein (DUF106 family)|nr:EMC3/TMCO1 family protein [Nanoarchaeota archaeon]
MTKNKEGNFRLVAVFMVVTMIIAYNWDKWTWLSGGVDAVFSPTLGALLDWHMEIGMLIILFILSIIMTFVQKYTTDQAELKKIKALQKDLQAKSKEHKDNPKKAMEIQKEMMGLMPKQMKLGMRTIVYTGIPFILFFRWFQDFFTAMGSPKFFGFLGWFWFYMIFFMIFSTIIKKRFDVV